MKMTYLGMGVVLAGLMAMGNGCSKQEETPVTSTPSTSRPSTPASTNKVDVTVPAPGVPAPTTATQAVQEIKATTEQAVQQTATAATSAVKTATDTAAQTAATTTKKFDDLLAQAKSLVTDKKYSEALNTVTQLGALQLTPDQQKLVNDLKTQLQQAMAGSAATEGAKALTNILGGAK